MKSTESQVYLFAFRDISEYIRTEKIIVMDANNDVWYVTPNMMKGKEIRKLNNELGLHKINKCGEKMARNKKKK